MFERHAREYPWGDSPPEGYPLNFNRYAFPHGICSGRDLYDGDKRPAPFGSFPDGASPYGALDMAGNVSEWVADWCDSVYYANSPKSDPTGPASGGSRVIRGGSWSNYQMTQRSPNRGVDFPDEPDFESGSRCARL